jgi:hypothetical protein
MAYFLTIALPSSFELYPEMDFHLSILFFGVKIIKSFPIPIARLTQQNAYL